MILTEKFEVHDTLNPKLWTSDNTLREDVKNRVEEIVNQFISSLEGVPLLILDIRLVGSNASFNYTQFSDLDVHIVTNFELIDAPPELLQLLYNAVKAKFNCDYDISIRGIDVELYVEDIKSTAISNGIYSVKTNSWIKFPKRLDSVPQVNIDDDFEKWEDRINMAVDKESSVDIERVLNDIYIVRKNSLDIEGEYGKGNQLFKELRNAGLLDLLKDSYKKARSKELTLEKLQKIPLTEASRQQLLSKSKQSEKGFERFKKRVKSRVANSVKQYNRIDMNKLFKDNILTVDIEVKGETDTYTVKISFGGFLELLHDQLKRQDNRLDLKAITRALVNGFNRDDVYIHCSCPDARYRFAYWQTRHDVNSGEKETRAANITNPDDSLGSACKHVLLVLSNTSWILKTASTIWNYINYMEKHYQRLYADVMYPAIYQKQYEEPIQLDAFDDVESDEMSTSSDELDKANAEGKVRGQFQKGNKQGIRFASDDDTSQLSFVEQDS